MGELTAIRYRDDMSHTWNSFLQTAKNPLFMFNRAYMDYHRDRFFDHSLLFLKDEKVVAILPMNEVDDVLFSHGGLTYGGLITNTAVKQHTVNECFDTLSEYAKQRGFKKIIYKPIPHVFHLWPSEEDLYALKLKGGYISEVSASSVIDLRKPLKMPKGRKAQISRAKREGVVVDRLNSKEQYTDFIALENEVLESRHNTKAVHTADELYLLHSRFPDQINLYGAMYQNEMIAGAVVFEYTEAIHTQYLAANDTAREIGALDLTISRIIEDYKDEKNWLDFGISTEDHGRILNEGLISQKEGFGGRTNVYMTWELPF